MTLRIFALTVIMAFLAGCCSTSEARAQADMHPLAINATLPVDGSTGA